MRNIRDDAKTIVREIIAENMPRQAVVSALKSRPFKNRVYLVAIGKAAWTMAKAASDFLAEKIVKGIVITKYGHSQGDLPLIEIIEAGHPVSDENTVSGTEKAIKLVSGLGAGDEILFLVSGGGSALFEKPPEGITLKDIADINRRLLACGADIAEINIIRKRLSTVKAGRFAGLCYPAGVFAIVLSDVLGDNPDVIASGPTTPDKTTAEDAEKVVEKYNLRLSEFQQKYLRKETPEKITNVETIVIGSVRTLCESASKTCESLGYTPYVLTTAMNCEAKEAGRLMASIATDIQSNRSCFKKPCAVIAGGETVVHVKGNGLGGRNQELVLSAAAGIDGYSGTLIFSIGSDGTDGPTDAAGGMADGGMAAVLRNKGMDIDKILDNNDAYHGLKEADGLIITGPTGTNVNDVSVILCL